MSTNNTQQVVLRGAVKGHLDKNPNNPNRYKVEALIPVDQVQQFEPEELGGTMPWCNPRLGFSDIRGTSKSRVRRDIEESLRDVDGRFHERNNGIKMIATDAKLEDGTITIDFGSGIVRKNQRGLGDGGTTSMVIISAFKDGFEQSKDKDKQQFVKITIYCGDYGKDEVYEMVRAWNTNLQVDDFSLANQRGDFKWIEKVVSQIPLFPKVAYFFGDTGDYAVEDVIQVLCAFAMLGDREDPNYPDFTSQAAARVYSGVDGCLKFYLEDLAQGSNSMVKKLEPLIADMLLLNELIPTEIAGIYNSNGGRFNGLTLIKNLKRPVMLPFTKAKLDYSPSKAWVLPILSAFRGNLQIENGKASWRVPVVKLWRDIAPILFEAVRKSFEDSGNFNALGRNKELYENLALKVDKYVTKNESRYTKKAGV